MLLSAPFHCLNLAFSSPNSLSNQISFDNGGRMYGNTTSSDTTITLAFGSFDLIARNAAKLAVPPPIKRYGMCLGMCSDVSGDRTERFLEVSYLL